MEKTNSVHLNGVVNSCTVRPGADGARVADISFHTLLPNPDAPPDSDRKYIYEKHLVRVTGRGPEGDRLDELERLCRSRVDVRDRTYDLRGVLREEGADVLVDCRAEDFVKSQVLELSRNNEAVMVGSVVRTTHTDRFASVVLDTGSGHVTAMLLKDDFGEAWESVAKGKVRKGSALSVKGPLRMVPMTDGKDLIFRSNVIPRIMEQVRLSQKRTVGPSL